MEVVCIFPPVHTQEWELDKLSMLFFEWLSQRKAIKQLIIKSYEKGLFVKDESSENIS